MRTTLTLDDDVTAKLREEMAKRGTSMRETVNACLRLGLSARRETKPTGRFRVAPRELRPRVSIDYDNIAELLEQAEGPLHR